VPFDRNTKADSECVLKRESIEQQRTARLRVGGISKRGNPERKVFGRAPCHGTAGTSSRASGESRPI